MLVEIIALVALAAIIHVSGDAPDPQSGVDLPRRTKVESA